MCLVSAVYLLHYFVAPGILILKLAEVEYPPKKLYLNATLMSLTSKSDSRMQSRLTIVLFVRTHGAGRQICTI